MDTLDDLLIPMNRPSRNNVSAFDNNSSQYSDESILAFYEFKKW